MTYYLEVRRRFLRWRWWARATLYHAGYDITFDMSYNTLAEAKRELDLLTENVINRVVGL